MFTLTAIQPSSVAFTGLPSGGVGAVGFYETAGDASAVRAELAGIASISGAEPTETELHGRALVAWRRQAREGDQALLASCLESGGENVEGTPDDPENPLGCVRVFIESPSTPTQVARIEASLRAEPLAREVQFLSKEKALEEMRRKHPELTANLRENPLPDAFRVSPMRGEAAPQLANLVRRYPRAEIVRVSSLPCSFIEPSLTG